MEANLEKLLVEVETLGSLFVPKGAEGETWGETCERIERMWKLAKKIRKAQATAAE